MGASVVGRLPYTGWPNRSQTGIHDSRIRRRSVAQASAKTCFGTLASSKSRQADAYGNGNFCGLYREVFRPQCSAYIETIHTQTVSIDTQLSPQTCIRSQASMRYLYPRNPNLCTEQVRFRFGMGSLQSSPQSDVEGLCQCEKVGTLRRRQSRNWGRSTGKGSGPRTNSSYTGTKQASVACSVGTGSNDGPNRNCCRSKGRGDSRLALARRGLSQSVDSDSTSRLSGHDWIAEDQRQQTHPTLTRIALSGPQESLRRLRTAGRPGIPYPHRNAIQRLEPPRPPSQTGWQGCWSALGGLAYPPTDPRNSALANWSFSQGRSGATRARTHVHDYGHLYPTNSKPSTRRRRENGSIGDEWRRVGRFTKGH